MNALMMLFPQVWPYDRVAARVAAAMSGAIHTPDTTVPVFLGLHDAGRVQGLRAPC